jgi:hypothetical protein
MVCCALMWGLMYWRVDLTSEVFDRVSLPAFNQANVEGRSILHRLYGRISCANS